MFWKRKKIDKPEGRKIVLGMIMLQDENSFDLDILIKDYQSNYSSKTEEPSGDNSAAAFKIDDEMVAIAHMPFPIPSNDIEEAAQYAYNWQTVSEDTARHKSHLIISVIHGGQDQIKRFKIFTQLVSSLLRVTNSIGVYEGSQSLLVQKEDFLDQAKLMSDKYLPLNLWVYFGLRANKNGNSGYTYGLKEFNKPEMEVLNSSKSLEDIRDFLFNITHYVLNYDVTIQDGETCEVSEERIPIRFAKGQLVEGDTLQLVY
jgi:hypothetical protein